MVSAGDAGVPRGDKDTGIALEVMGTQRCWSGGARDTDILFWRCQGHRGAAWRRRDIEVMGHRSSALEVTRTQRYCYGGGWTQRCCSGGARDTDILLWR